MSHLQSVYAVVLVIFLAMFGAAWLQSSYVSRSAASHPQHDARRQAEDPNKQPDRKVKESFWERTADDPIAVFTLGVLVFTAVLAASTIALWRTTLKASEAALRTAKSLHIAERCHVSGGAQKRIVNPREFVVLINNYGKTPAFIGTVMAKISPIAGLPEQPDYGTGAFMGYTLKPDTKDHQSITRMYDAPDTPSIIYGRIFYRDIFNACHSSGFALTIRDDDLPAAKVPRGYWEDRDEPDLGPAARSD